MSEARVHFPSLPTFSLGGEGEGEGAVKLQTQLKPCAVGAAESPPHPDPLPHFVGAREKLAAIAHFSSSAAIASANATVLRAISACRSSTMRPSSAMAPLPLFSGRSKAAMIL